MNLYEGPAGARDLILECQELLQGLRAHLTPLAEYKAQRLQAWQSGSAEALDAGLSEQAA
jgi:hypothetical protein